MNMINETHDVELQSWVASANDVSTDFPIQNLPFAAFRRLGVQEPSRGGVAIGDQIVDLRLLHQARLYEGLAAKALDAAAEGQLNYFMALGKGIWSALRLALSRSLRIGSADQAVLEACLVSQTDVEYVMPAYVGDYTDFYASIHHARNIGALFRPDNPLPPNYQWMPIGYHGRASSINVSGNNVVRPSGQIKAPDSDIPVHSVCKQLDYELEVGIFIGEGNEQGQPISIEKAEDHVFGLCVLNDWSARDIQAWEYQPLGPFLAKSFASTISPWIITMEALAPYRTAWTRPEGDPQPLSYLESTANREQGGFDLKLEVLLETEKMRETGATPVRLAQTNFDYSYWTVAQMVTHQTSNGCNLRGGNLFGSGTMSGPLAGQEGALIESTQGGKAPVDLGNGETRTFLEDGDRVIMRAWCEQEGKRRIGLGEASSTVSSVD